MPSGVSVRRTISKRATLSQPADGGAARDAPSGTRPLTDPRQRPSSSCPTSRLRPLAIARARSASDEVLSGATTPRRRAEASPRSPWPGFALAQISGGNAGKRSCEERTSPAPLGDGQVVSTRVLRGVRPSVDCGGSVRRNSTLWPSLRAVIRLLRILAGFSFPSSSTRR
jgi:hypothetical protein